MDYLVSAQWLLAKLGAVQMVPSVKVDHFGRGLALAGPAWLCGQTRNNFRTVSG